jgi:hypothetical protein
VLPEEEDGCVNAKETSIVIETTHHLIQSKSKLKSSFLICTQRYIYIIIIIKKEDPGLLLHFG